MKIDGSIALVTGANRGLGLKFTEALIEFGTARVYAAARDSETVAPLVQKYGAKVQALQLDVTDDAQVRRAAAAADDVTLLVNNAGALTQRGVLEADDLGGLELEMAVNVYGVARMCRAFAPLIGKNGGGGVVNMLSTASLMNFPPFGTYAASKAAAMSLTDCLRYELRGQGVEVFGVYAGYIDTDMLGNVVGEKASPGDIARSTMEGVEAGMDHIYADERAKMVASSVIAHPKEAIANIWARAEEFRKNHPLSD